MKNFYLFEGMGKNSLLGVNKDYSQWGEVKTTSPSEVKTTSTLEVKTTSPPEVKTTSTKDNQPKDKYQKTPPLQNTNLTLAGNTGENESGGGDFLDLKKNETSNLIFPKNLTQKEQLYAEKLLSNCDGHAQEILDALDAAIQAGQIKKSPLAFLGGLIRRQEIGTFDPTPGMHIATARAKQKRTQESINASIKKHHAETSVKSKAERMKPNEQINAMKQALKKSH
jgi:hypothetical protein